VSELRAVPGGAAPTPVRTTELGPAFDLLAAFDGPGGFLIERGGLGLAASAGGTALEVAGGDQAIRDVGRAALRRLRGSTTLAGAVSPVAVGSLPFDTGTAALWVPARVVRRTRAGETWLVELPPDGGELPAFEPMPVRGTTAPHDAFSELQLTALPTAEGYAEAVRIATGRIRAGGLRKVVLARQIRVAAARALDPRLLAARLRSVDPDAYTFAAPTPGGTLVGASPELLLARHGREIRSNPLAGSAPRAGDPAEDRANADDLAASGKNREEHAIVVEAVAETLRRFCEELEWDPEPVLLPTANVWHLSTRFRGRLRDPAPSVLDLVGALHPTPAVCGDPRTAARTAIGELEPFDRGGYAGPVGWMDAEGNGEWVIALRCAELGGDEAMLFAGAGIVAGSDPADEVDETDRKFRAFLDALRWV
jgi:isochorismate synthase